jgi:hypothetical protein
MAQPAKMGRNGGASPVGWTMGDHPLMMPADY